MKKCPYCAEEIQDEAIKCRFCGEFLKKRKKWKSCLFGCLIVFLTYILLSAGFFYLVFFIPKLIFQKLFFWSMPFYPHQYPPSAACGTEGFSRDFGEGLKAFWESIKAFLHFGAQGGHKITF